MVTPPILIISNNLIVMSFGSLMLEIKFTTITNMSYAPFDMQRSNVHVVNASCTHVFKVFSTNFGHNFFHTYFPSGNTTLWNNLYANIWSQMDSTIVIGRNLLMTTSHFQNANLCLMVF